ncbi:MAG: phosphoribosyltransferase family protein [Oscillospiraceae bacterium]|nr:phosphoribosyltransferase family protein [Oscillospiraceae bacterium]
MSEKYKRSADFLLDAIFPRKCVCCNEIIDGEEELCDNCIRFIERVDPLKRCLFCGLEKPDCDCKYYLYHFKGAVAPFFNSGLAKKGIYDFKLNAKAHYSVFFAREMARTVTNELRDVRFDAAVYVPSSRLSYLKRGINHSFVLAKRVAEFLDIPLIKDSLLAKFHFGAQHKSDKLNRFKRARKVFRYNTKCSADLSGKTLLLIDDIKTTGATLDECSRQLLLAGAKEVYCVTAVISNRNKGQKKINYVMTDKKAEKILSDFGNNIY